MNNKRAQIGIIAIFLIFTFGFSILFFALPKKDYSSGEKRYLAKAPEFSVESFLNGTLTSALEGGEAGGYIPDHFPFRSFFVGTNSYFNLLTFSTAENGYYFGDKGYIITKPAQKAALRYDKNLELINRFAASFDEVALAVVPSPGYIMEDLLPLNRVDYPDEAVYSYIESHRAENIKVCSLAPTFFKEYGNGSELYYKTDHHWTSLGAYTAYRELGSTLGYTPKGRDTFTISEYPGFYGTTYSSSGYFLAKADTLMLWEDKSLQDSIKVTITEGSKEEVYHSMYFLSHLTEDDMYPVFLDGNHALVTVENKRADSDKTLVLIKDSFAHCAAPLLAENYSKIIMVDLRYYKESVADLCKESKADQVLFLYGMNNFCTDSNFGYLG